MSFYRELEPFLDYIHSVRRLKNYLSFDMKFPQKWILTKNIIDNSEVLPFDVKDDESKGFSFVSVIEEESITETLSKVSKIIKMNKDRELKESLFKKYVEELKTTFEKNNLEKLQNLHFEFEENISEFIHNEQVESKSEAPQLVGDGKEKRRVGATVPQKETN